MDQYSVLIVTKRFAAFIMTVRIYKRCAQDNLTQVDARLNLTC